MICPVAPDRSIVEGGMPSTRARTAAVAVVLAVEAAAPDRRWRRPLSVLAPGSGMREREILGLTLDRVAFHRRRVDVNRQRRTPNKSKPALTDASERTLSRADTVLEALSEHIWFRPSWPLRQSLARCSPTGPQRPSSAFRVGTPAQVRAGVRRSRTLLGVRPERLAETPETPPALDSGPELRSHCRYRKYR
jgi:integrase